jgi:hypothetical protein
MKYEPRPLDTSDIVLPDAVGEVADLLSKNVHEVWAAQKVSDGFSYGETDDKILKTHHNLVPYEDLSQEDRQYDCNTALETVRVLLKLGFVIQKKDAPPSNPQRNPHD